MLKDANTVDEAEGAEEGQKPTEHHEPGFATAIGKVGRVETGRGSWWWCWRVLDLALFRVYRLIPRLLPHRGGRRVGVVIGIRHLENRSPRK